MTAGEKATITKVYELIMPMTERQVKIETTLDNFIVKYDISHKELATDLAISTANLASELKENHEKLALDLIETKKLHCADHKETLTELRGKISIKSFIAWTSAVMVLIGLALFLLKFFGVLL
jgi:DNA-binding Xre family transcriptional regulator